MYSNYGSSCRIQLNEKSGCIVPFCQSKNYTIRGLDIRLLNICYKRVTGETILIDIDRSVHNSDFDNEEAYGGAVMYSTDNFDLHIGQYFKVRLEAVSHFTYSYWTVTGRCCNRFLYNGC